MPKAKKLTKVNKVEKVEKVEKVKKVKKEKKPTKVNKVKRKPSAYAQFVKEHYKDSDVQAVPPKQRFKLIAEKWKKHKTDSKDV